MKPQNRYQPPFDLLKALSWSLATSVCLVSCAAPSAQDGTEEARQSSEAEFSVAEELLAGSLIAAAPPKADCCLPQKAAPDHGEGVEEVVILPSKMKIPDLELIDSNGRKARFYSDLVQGRVVAMNFIFTTCTTICPPLTATFAGVQGLLGERLGRDVHMITVSVDPVNDTPERMRAWGEKFGARPGWTLLTGTKQNVDTILKALQVFTPLKEDHSPLVLVGNDRTGRWKRVNGLAPPASLVATIDEIAGTTDVASDPSVDDPKAITTPVSAGAVVPTAALESAKASPETATATENETPAALESAKASPETATATENQAARQYFTDVELVNQDGEPMRLYSDLIRGKIVVINCFFTSCTSVCPAMSKNLLAIQDVLGDRLGKDVHLISVSVDPLNDTPPKLKAYAERTHAKPGWYFVSGTKQNVDLALSKLGFLVKLRDQHSNVVLIGNDATGLWKKAFGLSSPDKLVQIVETVLDDVGA